MTTIFVTATGTDIGKTFVTAGLIRALRRNGRSVDALKPVVSGFDAETASASDPVMLLGALGRAVSDEALDRISPWRFKAPLSPDMAARREARPLALGDVIELTRERIAKSRSDALLVEGVGGVMVPIDERGTVVDWIAALRLPVLLVAGSYLGTISHTLTAVAVLKERGIGILAVVVSETAESSVPLDDTAETIGRFVAPIEVIVIPRLARKDAEHPAFARLAALV